MQQFNLSGMSVLVAGPSGCASREVGESFGLAKAKIMLLGQHEEKITYDKLFFESKGIKISNTLICDLNSVDAIEHLTIPTDTLNILVNIIRLERLLELKDSIRVMKHKISLSHALNVVAPVLLAHKCFPLLVAASRQTGDASIVNVVSIDGTLDIEQKSSERVGEYESLDISLTRTAICQATRHMALVFGAEGVRVNTLIHLSTSSEGAICGPIKQLASSSSKFMTGMDLLVR